MRGRENRAEIKIMCQEQITVLVIDCVRSPD